MVYQWIVGGANGLIFYDFNEMKAMNHKNPFDKEWEKLLNVVNELLKKFSNIILSRTKINPIYIIPKFDDYSAKYLFARRQFRFNHSDYILIVNHRNMPLMSNYINLILLYLLKIMEDMKISI